MPADLRIAYFAHTLRSDWNNGNAHFLRGLMRAMHQLGHDVTIYEPDSEWSIDNLRAEPRGPDSLASFLETYSDLDLQTYSPNQSDSLWREHLCGVQVVILHEWNPAFLARMLLRLRAELGFTLLFHDTHHRASSSPEQFRSVSLDRFDGVIAFGDSLRTIYRERFGITRCAVLHEAADTTVFFPRPGLPRETDVVWIGNWGDGERAREIDDFFLQPAAALPEYRFTIFGVRYPPDGLAALAQAGVTYGGYLPNLDAPVIYAHSGLTVHIPRRQYSSAMTGIPTIRVFEALACGIPLISAPWQDTEHLFREGDFLHVSNVAETTQAMRNLLTNPGAASAQAARGLETVLARHTCHHRAQELTAICQEFAR